MDFRNCLFMIAFVAAGSAWAANEPKAVQDDVAVKHAWITETLPNQNKASLQVELTCINSVGKLVAVESPLAESGEMQRMRVSHGRVAAETVTAVPMRHGKPMTFGPNTISLVLLGLKKPLQAGDVVPVNLTVITGGKKVIVEVKAKVKPAESEKPADAGEQAQSGILPASAPAK